MLLFLLYFTFCSGIVCFLRFTVFLKSQIKNCRRKENLSPQHTSDNTLHLHHYKANLKGYVKPMVAHCHHQNSRSGWGVKKKHNSIPLSLQALRFSRITKRVLCFVLGGVSQAPAVSNLSTTFHPTSDGTFPPWLCWLQCRNYVP